MLTSTLTHVLLTLTLLAIHTQFVSSLPQCIQNCINSSKDENCNALDIPCLCRASSGNFLPDLITCMHATCNDGVDDTMLLAPLQLACELAGTPIPVAALSSAEAQASSLATETATETVTSAAGATTSAAAATTSAAEYSTSDAAAASTSTQTSTAPTILPGSNSQSSTSTTTSTQSVVVSASSTSSSSSSGSTQTSTSTHISTILAGGQTLHSGSLIQSASKTSSSSKTSSKTSAAPDGGSTDSAPFTNTNDTPHVVGKVGHWFALTIAMAAGFALVLS